MMKKMNLMLLFVASAITLASCKSDDNNGLPNPFDTVTEEVGNEREKIVVISDLHIGNDLSYSENLKHIKRLEQFLNEVRSSETVKELVIGGDMLDEWYIPSRTDTYGGSTQADFVRKTVTANKGVFNVIKGIIKDGKIKVTYIPGNHDMGFTPANVDIAMPGVNQARDAGEKYPVGTYHPDGYSQIAIEHGHRYDFFCSITKGANETEAPGAIFAPGYFFARIAANSFTDPTTKEASTKVPVTTLNDPGNPEQFSKFVYYQTWKKVIEDVIFIKDNFNDPIIVTKVGNFTKTYAIKDILPQNSTIDGSIQIKLYNDIFTQANWNARQVYNNVPVMTNINEAIPGSLDHNFLDGQANRQYFQNPNSSVRIVVFGHSHEPLIASYTNPKGEKCIYVNSGTWEDQKTRDKNAAIDQDNLKMDFVVITPAKTNKQKLLVGLYNYHGGKHVAVDSDEVEL
ncbi:Metallophosphoesterase [Bacteroidales bacterium CF]|jgi:UDP-2,3-diacylglucosamine pyrophosphatase LpxH|nr:Metallophosphoesterase [Bacteroidales bacterium CF]